MWIISQLIIYIDQMNTANSHRCRSKIFGYGRMAFGPTLTYLDLKCPALWLVILRSRVIDLTFTEYQLGVLNLWRNERSYIFYGKSRLGFCRVKVNLVHSCLNLIVMIHFYTFPKNSHKYYKISENGMKCYLLIRNPTLIPIYKTIW